MSHETASWIVVHEQELTALYNQEACCLGGLVVGALDFKRLLRLANSQLLGHIGLCSLQVRFSDA